MRAVKLLEKTIRPGFPPAYFGRKPDRTTRCDIGRDGSEVVVADGHELHLEGPEGCARWDAPLVLPGWPDEALVSASRLLVLTSTVEYHARGFLGPALLVDRATGVAIAELRGERAAVYGEDSFLLGLEGYDSFDTWLIGPSGDVQDRWRSYGHYLVDGDDTVRVIESDRRTPTDSHVVRLRPGGVIQLGDRLMGCQAGAPVSLADGTAFFVDRGTLCSVGHDLKRNVVRELLPVTATDDWRYHGKVALEGASLVVTILERPDRTQPAKAPGDRVHRWLFDIGS